MNGQFDIGGVTPSRYFFSIAFVLGLLFALTSGEQQRPFALILLQWQLQTLLPMALLVGAHMLLLRHAGFATLNPWVALAISGLLGASLFAPVALAVEFWLEQGAPASPGWRDLANEWLGVAPPVIMAWLALNAPWQLGYRLEKSPDREAQEPKSESIEALPEFIQLLPQPCRGKTLLIKSELHYLKVVTERGNGLVLYNMVDAVAALPAESGIQVHRSYWVAFDAIDTLQRQGRQGELILRDGERVPVSRQRYQQVRDALNARSEDAGDASLRDEIAETVR